MNPPDLVVVVPSRERPEAIREMTQAFRDTCESETWLVPVIDDGDPTREQYPRGTWTAPSRNMVQALNWAVAQILATSHPPFAIGFMGDDHRPISPGWDGHYVRALNELEVEHGAGIVYGNDLLQGKNLPTQVAMTSSIPDRVGYMAPPQFGHLYVDNVWKAWGEGAGCLRYLPETIIEHRHPVARKAEWDEGYRRVNSENQYQADRQVWRRYQASELARDVAVVRSLRGGADG